MTLSCSDKGGWLYQPEDHIHILQSTLCHLDHVLSQLVFCLVDSRSIQKYNLSVLTGINSLDPVSGGLRFFGCYGDLLADQMIHQSGFPHIGTADNGCKA